MPSLTTPKRRLRLVAAVASVVAALAASALVATPANAATPPPADNRLGGFTDVTFSPDAWTLSSFETEGGFPERTDSDGYRVVGIAEGGEYQDQLTANKVSYAGSEGDSAGAAHWIQPLATRWSSLIERAGIGGEFTVYVESIPGGAAGPADPVGTVPISSTAAYYSETFVRTETGVEVKGGGSTPEKIATTTTLAGSGTTATSTTLTATIDKTAATGAVTFSQNGTEIGQADVTNGVASLTATALTPETEYSFTAEYLGDATHNASASTAVTVKTLVAAPPVDTEDTDIGVTVPEPGEPTSLRITITPGAVSLAGGDRDAGEVWTATGELREVTVTDDRQDAAAPDWSLNGSATKFTGTAGEFAASNLSWAPQHISGPGTAGPASDNLSTEQALASGDASATPSVITKVKAGLTLKVPADAAPGDYSSKLTLTLI